MNKGVLQRYSGALRTEKIRRRPAMLMASIYHSFPITAPRPRVFEAVTTPDGLSAWWTQKAKGVPRKGTCYTLNFGVGYVWQARVTSCAANRTIAWTFTESDPDWMETTVRLELHRTRNRTNQTVVHFVHRGWRERNSHYRTSSFCWAMYLRLLKRYVEHGEVIPYAARLEA